jgi:hypothetical protein
MQERIEHSRAQLVSVTSELLNHFQPKDRSFTRVIKNVQANHPGIKHATVVSDHSYHSLSDFDNELRYSGGQRNCQIVVDLATEVAGLRTAELYFR